MTPATAIAQLDRQLAAHGQAVKLRPGSTATGEVVCTAFVRGFKPTELIGGLTQQHSLVVLSPTDAGSFASGNASPLDTRVPKAGNFIVVAGKPRKVTAGVGIYMGTTLVRIEATVEG